MVSCLETFQTFQTFPRLPILFLICRRATPNLCAITRNAELLRLRQTYLGSFRSRECDYGVSTLYDYFCRPDLQYLVREKVPRNENVTRICDTMRLTSRFELNFVTSSVQPNLNLVERLRLKLKVSSFLQNLSKFPFLVAKRSTR